jgi:tRNA G46 methylase TrmB
LVYEAQKNNKDATDAYKRIKTEYPESAEAQNIDEYIARTEAKLIIDFGFGMFDFGFTGD